MSNSLQLRGLQHTRPPCPLSHAVCTSSSPLNQWCHRTIWSSVVPFSCLLSFPASESFPVNQLFTSGGQSIEASALVLPVNIQDWFPLGWTGLIPLQSKGLSRVFTSTTVQKASILQCLADKLRRGYKWWKQMKVHVKVTSFTLDWRVLWSSESLMLNMLSWKLDWVQSTCGTWLTVGSS